MRSKSSSPQPAGERSLHLSASGVGFFADREKECDRLRDAILAGQSLMVGGLRGSGKTLLVMKVISDLPPELKNRCVYIGRVRDLQEMLRSLIRALYVADDVRLKRQLHDAGVSKTSFDDWLKSLPTTRLRGTLYRTVDAAGYRVFFDHIGHLTTAMARVIKELFWMRQTPVYLISSEDLESRIISRFFYWGEREILQLGPLPLSAASLLLEHCIQRFGLGRLDLDGFREQILASSQLVPGAIVGMCELASKPEYQFGSQIKARMVHVDYLMRGCIVSPKGPRSG
jgi:hypothetical protein